MAGKQISITVKMFDQATSVAKTVAQSMTDLGLKGTRAFGGGLLTSIKGVGSALFSMKSLVASVLGAFAVRGAISSLDDAAQKMDAINDAMARTGASAEFLSQWKYIADVTNVGFEGLSEGFKTLQKNASQFAQTGGGKARDAFIRLGVPIKDATGRVRELEDLLPDLVDRLAEVKDAAQQSELAQRIFGGSGDSFLQFIKEGGERLRAMAGEARKLGVVFSEEQLQRAAMYRDAVDRVSAAWFGLKARIVDEVAPQVTEFLNGLAEKIAALPEIVGNFARSISAALGGDLEALAKWRGLMDAIRKVALDAVVGTWRILTAVSVVGFDVLLGVADAMLGRWFAKWSEKAPIQGKLLAAQIARSIAEGLFSRLGADPGWIGAFALAEEFAKSATTDIDRMYADNGETIAAIDARIQRTFGEGGEANTSMAEFRNVWISIREQMGGSLSTLYDAADAVGGISAALAKVNIEDYPAFRRNIEETRKGLAGLQDFDDEQFFEGVTEGYKQMIVAANEFTGLGRDAFTGFAQGLSQIGPAIVSNITSIRDMGRAIRQVIANALQGVASLIAQFLVLRAVMGIAGAFFSAPATVGGSGGAPSFGGNFRVANRGGTMTRQGVQRFNAGGTAGRGSWDVPGPAINRDVIPALLTPGERVTDRANARRFRPELDEIARGRSPGSTFNVSVVVNAGGGMSAGAARRAGQEAAMGMLDELERNPVARARMRAIGL